MFSKHLQTVADLIPAGKMHFKGQFSDGKSAKIDCIYKFTLAKVMGNLKY